MRALLILFILSISTALASESVSIIDDTDFDTGGNIFLTTLAGQNSTNITASETLEFNINNASLQFSATANATLSNITYSSDVLNFTASASQGALNVSAKMLNNNKLYYLFVDGTKNASTTSNASGWISFNYSGWSQHDFSIQADINAPTLTSESVSPSSVQQGYSTTITAQFLDNTAVSSAIVNVQSPDGLITNWSMACTSGASVTCTKTYSSTVILGAYYIKYYYPQDDSGNVANISSTKTFLVTALVSQGNTGGGGGGGGSSISPSDARVAIYDDQNNPPGIKIEIIEISPPSAKLVIKITNEGQNGQEYVYSWTLEKLNLIGMVSGQIDKLQASKLVQVGENVSIPVSFSSLKDGKYALKVDVNYGEHTSKAEQRFDMGQQTQLVTRQAKDVVWEWKYYIILVVFLAMLLYFVAEKPAMERIKRPPMPPNLNR